MASAKKVGQNALSRRFLCSVWLFPAILTILLLTLTALRISGSSVGIYHKILYGEQAKDPSLLYENPQPVRSDEWLVNTQLVLAQEADGYKRINENIGTSRDMSLSIDVPAKDWTAPFKPQNLAFFVLPFENAFAFKWWLLLYLLIIGGYFFALRLFPGKRLFAALASLGFGFSPFVFWWYLSGTIAPLFYAFFILIIGMRTLNAEPISFLKKFDKKLSYAIYALVLAYLLVCFGLVLYPPFQIPIAIVVAIFLFGYLLQKYFDKKESKTLVAKRLLVLIVGAVLACTTLFIVFKTHPEPWQRISNSVYPGKRVVSGGTLQPKYVLTSYLQPQLQRDSRAFMYYNNPSEASNFILIMPILVIPGFCLIGYEWVKKKRIDWVLVSLQAGCVLLLTRVFVPVGDGIYKLLYLHVVPNERVLIGVGFIGFLQMLYVIKKVDILQLKAWWQKALVFGYSFAWLNILILLGLQIRQDYPKFINSVPLIVAGSLVLVSISTLILFNKKLAAILIFAGFSVFSSFRIHPLYVGLGPIKDNRLSSQIKSLSQEEDTWGTVDNIYFENFGFINDRDSITGVHFYPDPPFWQQTVGSRFDYVYNRYAHVLLSTSPAVKDTLNLTQPDLFTARLECSDFVRNNIDYLLSTYPINTGCTRQISEVNYPAVTFYIYSVN